MIDDSGPHVGHGKVSFERRRPAGRRLRLGLLACIWMSPAAWAVPAVPERLNSLVVQGLRWEPVQSMSMSGVPTHFKSFSSDEAMLTVARSLAAHSGLFQRVLAVKDTIILSGLQADWHWLAQVDTVAAGAAGYVSAMRIGLDSINGGQADVEPGFTWLPAPAQRRFAYRSSSPSPTVAQYVYSIGLPMQALTAYVRRQLRAEGWEAEPTIAGLAGHSAWRRSTSRLMLFPQERPSGTDLYIHHVE
ncbi:hypothetical protein V0R37_14805 [Pollutimonas sp. H1-120]|uniref:hypothetical protein n=1 Tax=Pollutimonas sp. H1-120 TaxID=3148824 RepID=UPI003B52B674